MALSWQKSTDLASYTAFESNLGQFTRADFMKDHAVSDFHRAVRFTGSFNYELPGPTRSVALHAGRLAAQRYLYVQTARRSTSLTGSTIHSPASAAIGRT